VAPVVAETYEQARSAARLVKVSYDAEKHATDTEAVRASARAPSQGRPSNPRGNPEEAWKSAPVKVEAEYRIAMEHHNPMEPSRGRRRLGGRQAHHLRQDAGGLRCAPAPRFDLRRAGCGRERRFALRRRGPSAQA